MPTLGFNSWLGVTGLWSNPNFWSAGVVPDQFAGVLLGGAGLYTVLVNDTADVLAQADFIDITNSSAILSVATGNSLRIGSDSQGGLTNSGTVSISGSVFVGWNNENSNLAPVGTFDNTGVMVVNSASTGASGSLFINESVDTASLGTIENNGLIILLGTLNNTGASLLAANYGSLTLDGVVTGGTIIGDGGNLIAAGFAVFNAVTIEGKIFVKNSPTFDAASVIQPLSGQSQATIEILDGSALLEKTGIIDNLLVDMSGSGGGFGTFGTLSATTSVISVAPLGQVAGKHTISAAAFQGTVSNTASLLVLTHFNQGWISTSGTLAETDFDVGGINGTLDGTIDNTGTISAGNFGYVKLIDHVIGTGTIALDSNGTVEIVQSYGAQTFDFLGTSALLRLDSTGGTNDVLGFAPGETIEFTGNGASLTFAAGTLAATNGPFTLGSFVMHGVPANAQFSVFTDANLNSFITEAIPCFAAGTAIATPAGPIPVEHLRPGDRVLSAFGGSVPVVWIGHRRVACRRHPRPHDVQPIRIHAGAFAPATPCRDLRLSPDHAVHVDNVLIPIRYLVNGRTIVQEPVDAITYFHLELPAHDVVLAEGLPCESYLDTGNRRAFANAPIAALHPDFAPATWQADACATLVLSGLALVAARQSLLARAAALGHPLTPDPALRLLADGKPLPFTRIGRRHQATIPAGTATIHIVSRTWTAACTRPAESDPRPLGIALANLALDGIPLAPADPRLAAGWHAPEPDWRWTDGLATIAPGNARHLAFDLALTGTYWAEDQQQPAPKQTELLAVAVGGRGSSATRSQTT